MLLDPALAWPAWHSHPLLDSGPRQPAGGWGHNLSAALSGISERDRRIVELARRKLGGAPADFAQALRGLREAVEELIPAGRTFLLGTTEFGPIVGSIVSGVGIFAAVEGVRLVRVTRDGQKIPLGLFLP